jgi:DNA uptake protein ComE-like DNA-binding protein
MTRTRIALIPRLAVSAATLLLVVAAGCKSSSSDAARADSAAATAAGTSAPAPSVPATSAGAMATDSSAAPAAATTSAAMLDPNTATRDQLLTVAGMTAPAADALVAGRPYKTMVAVDQTLAKQLSPEARKTVYARVWQPIDLNTATGEEILLIPGVGPRMRHEFEEYRPYKAIETFRREIGKYVDKKEVARLEQYVTIK